MRTCIHWEKPELGIVEFEGSTANNIILEGIGTGVIQQQDQADPPLGENIPHEIKTLLTGGTKKIEYQLFINGIS